MKILFIDGSVYRGGAEISMEKILKYLPLGVSCDIMKTDELELRYDASNHIEIAFPVPSSVLLENKKSIRSINAFVKLFIAGMRTDLSEYDFFVSNTFKAHILCLGLKASEKNRGKWILAERDAPENIFIKAIKYFIHRSSTMTVFVSENLMKAYFYVKESVVIGNIVERSGKNIEKNRKIFLYAGGLTQSKGYDRAVEVFMEIRERMKDSVMYVAGGIPVYAEKTEPKIPEGIVNLGHTDLSEYFTQSSFLLFFNRKRESFSRICAEAMSFGCVIAVLKGNGMDDYAENLANALVFEKYDKEKIADRIIEIADDNEAFERLSANAVKKANEKFAPEIIIKKWRYLLGLPD